MLTFKKYYDQKRKFTEKHLKSVFKNFSIPLKLKEAMSWSLFAGGKRLRPVIVLMVEDALRRKFDNEHNKDTVSFALALECIHTYSLIHDDLPAMDDDDLRRGKPTCHVKYGEAAAILAGDGLLTHAFSLLITRNSTLCGKRKSRLFHLLADCAGPAGMAGGQMLDLESENKKISLADLKKIHALKTGALFKAAFTAAAIMKKRSAEEKLLTSVSRKIGLAFQIADDVLDITADEKTLGKPIGSDDKNQKSAYTSLMGLEKSKKTAKKLTNEAISELKASPLRSIYIEELAHYIVERTN